MEAKRKLRDRLARIAFLCFVGTSVLSCLGAQAEAQRPGGTAEAMSPATETSVPEVLRVSCESIAAPRTIYAEGYGSVGWDGTTESVRVRLWAMPHCWAASFIAPAGELFVKTEKHNGIVIYHRGVAYPFRTVSSPFDIAECLPHQFVNSMASGVVEHPRSESVFAERLASDMFRVVVAKTSIDDPTDKSDTTGVLSRIDFRGGKPVHVERWDIWRKDPYPNVEGWFSEEWDSATSVPKTMRLIARGFTTRTVELSLTKCELADTEKVDEELSEDKLAKDGWAPLLRGDIRQRLIGSLTQMLSASPFVRDYEFQAFRTYPLECAHGTFQVKLSSQEEATISFGKTTKPWVWGVVEVVNDLPTTVSLGELMVVYDWRGALHSNATLKDFAPQEVRRVPFVRTLGMEERFDPILIGLYDRGAVKRWHRLARVVAERVGPVSFEPSLTQVVVGTEEKEHRLRIVCKVDPDAVGEVRGGVKASDGLDVSIKPEKPLLPGSTTILDVRVRWKERPPAGTRAWVRLIGFDDTLFKGSGWIALDF